ncbi:hypothetical protein [Solimicrobium silvestre]|nr:hypothetical protein [Solimicrobium silvestre]
MFLASLCLIVFVPFNAAIAQNDQTGSTVNSGNNSQNQASIKRESPFSFTPDEMQDKLMQVLKIPAKELSKEKVEAIFGIKMGNPGEVGPESLHEESTHQRKKSRWYKSYIQVGVDWSFSLGITVGPNSTGFGFRWWNLKNSSNPFALPMCIDLQKISEAIEHTNMGWELFHDPHGTRHANLSRLFTRSAKRFDTVNVEYVDGANCMSAFDFDINTQGN